MRQILIAIDQLANSIIGGWADETLSSRCWRMGRYSAHWEALRRLIDLLFFWDADHCRMSYESERLRLQAPPELRA